jgi:hypothetical protein
MSLTDIQQKLKAPKNQYNTFGEYKYRSCEDILEAVKPLLGECTLFVFDDIVQLGDRYYVKATAELQDGNKIFRATAYAREIEDRKKMDPAQLTGAASSYARKYALNGLFLIDDTKDADSTNKHDEEKPEADPPSIPPKDGKLALAKPKTKGEAIGQIIEAKGDEATACKWASEYFQRDILGLNALTIGDLRTLWKAIFEEAK